MSRGASVSQKPLLSILIAAVALLLPACGGGDSQKPTEPTEPEAQLARVEVRPDSAELTAEGDTAHFEATALDEDGNEMSGVDFEWDSSDPSVATVDSSGVAKAQAEGVALIVAEVDQVSDSSQVQVESTESSPPIPASIGRTLPARFWAASTWDPVNERVLVHGGSDRRTHGELWSYDPSTGSWSLLSEEGPTRWGHHVVWDSSSEHLLLFGGNDGSQGFAMTNELWSYDIGGGNWTKLDPAGTRPDPREQPAVAFAPERQEMFVFGGVIGDKTDVVNDLWVYRAESNQWVRLQPSGSTPPARKGHTMIWDSQEQRLLVYGGWNSLDPRFRDLWQYDPEENRWREISTGGEPPKRFRHGVAWDRQEQHMYIYAGCCGPNGKKEDLWRYDAEDHSWRELNPGSPKPSGRNRLNDQMLWVPSHEAFVVYGGRGECPLLNDLWSYVPRQKQWVELSEGGSANPLQRTDHKAAALNGRVYSFGGCNGSRQTADLVRFDPGSGQVEVVQPGGSHPPARSKHGLAAAPSDNRLYLYGGTGTEQGTLGEVWSYRESENKWAKHDVSGTQPPSRFDAAWVWDPDSERLLLFGGVDVGRGNSKNDRFVNDLWSFDPSENTWTQLQENRSGSGPRPRKHQMGVWDEEEGRLLIYGGHAQRDDGSKINYKDLWAYDPASGSWTLLDDGEPGPEHRVDTGAAWEPTIDGLFLYGGMKFSGSDADRRLGDLWSYETSIDEWTERSSGSPEARQQHELVHVNGSLILIGGYGSISGRYLATVWSYNPATDTWTQAR